MKRTLKIGIVASLAAIVVSLIAFAQPSPSPGLYRVATNSPGKLAGSGTTANPLTDTNSVTSPIAGTGSSGSPLTWTPTLAGILSGTGSAGSPLTATEIGDISAVTTAANVGIEGGASSGAVALKLRSDCADNQVLKSGGTGTTWTCSTPTAGTVTSSPLTTNTIPKATGVNAISDGLITDDGTTVTIGGTAKVGKLALTTTTDSTLTVGTNNDYALGATTTWLILSNATGGTITGFTGGVDARELYVTTTGGNWSYTNQGATSTAANRLALSQAVNWTTNNGASNAETIHLRYDASALRWRQIINSGFAGTVQTGNINGSAFTNTNQVTTGSLTLSGASSDVSTGTINDFAIANTFYVLRWTGASSATYNGFANAVSGRAFWVVNASTSSSVNLTIANEAAGSTAANRFWCPNNTDVVLPGGTANQNSAAFVWYDTTSSRWRVWAPSNSWKENGTTLSTTENVTHGGTTTMTGDAIVTTTKNKGTITLSTGTGTATVQSGSVCTCSDSTANASVKCVVTTTTLTATGTGSDVIAYLCF